MLMDRHICKIVRLYAIRSREFAEAVACLGGHWQNGRQFLGMLEEIDRQHILCAETARELKKQIEQDPCIIKPQARAARAGRG